ncbi:MAG: DciA family protein [Geobacteraceae bacterium]|nr:DciA family protein [Geobacteraceae bacterium]
MADRRRKSRKPQAIATLLAGAFQGKPLERRLEEAKIWQIWDRAVGSQLAAKAKPIRFNNGLLTVAVSSAPWMQQLNFMKRDIAQRLNQMIGKELVREIYLRPGRPAKTETEQVERPPGLARRELTGEEREKIARASQEIGDEDLRRAFVRLMEIHYSSERTET